MRLGRSFSATLLGALFRVWSAAAEEVAAPPFPVVVRGDGNVDRDFVVRVMEYPGSREGATRKQNLERAENALRNEIAALSTRLRNAEETKVKCAEGIANRCAAQLKDSISRLEFMLGTVFMYEKGQDPYALQLDFYAAVVYSNLFRGAEMDKGFFSKSGSAFLMELSQAISVNRRLEVFGQAGSGTTSLLTADTASQAITASGNVVAKGGLIYWLEQPSYGWVGVGGIAGGGYLGVPAKTDSSVAANDELKSTFEVGAIAKELGGEWRNSYIELAYLRDPRFENRDRFLARARFVLSPDTDTGKGVVGTSGLGAFIEGSINSGKGPAEARVTVGVKLDAIKVLKAIVGVTSTSAPGSAPTGGS